MVLFLWIVFTIAVGVFAHTKKRSVIVWTLISLILSPLVGFIFLLVLPAKTENDDAGSKETGSRLCPFCAETIKIAAIKCKHCGSDLILEGSLSLADEEIEESMAQLMSQYGITKDADGYKWGNSRYKTISELKVALEALNT